MNEKRTKYYLQNLDSLGTDDYRKNPEAREVMESLSFGAHGQTYCNICKKNLVGATRGKDFFTSITWQEVRHIQTEEHKNNRLMLRLGAGDGIQR